MFVCEYGRGIDLARSSTSHRLYAEFAASSSRQPLGLDAIDAREAAR